MRYALLLHLEPLLHQLDDCHLSCVTTAGAGTGHSGVAAVTVSVLGSDLVEQLLNKELVRLISKNEEKLLATMTEEQKD